MKFNALQRVIALCWLLLSMQGQLTAQYHANLDQSTAQEAIWVDSVYNSMTQEQRIGQLFMMRAYSNKSQEHTAAIERLINQHHIGGLCFFQGTPAKQVRLVNHYQSQSDVPLMIAIDGEWGLNMRMKESVVGFPKQLTLGAIRDNHLIYRMGVEIANQMHRVGVHVNFAPVVDVNNNPNNPVIGTRSFGENRVNVAIKGIHYMKGMQDNGIIACAKHFPGHGDTDVDSHYGLPIIPHDMNRLDSIELYPFKALVEQGVGSVMVGHLQVPAIEQRPNYPTSLSEKAITGLLKEKMNFHGLVITDGLGMKGVTDHFGDGEVEIQALLAGNDMLLLPEDIVKAKRKILHSLKEGQFSEKELRKKVKRILRSKYRIGLNKVTPVTEEGIQKELNNPILLALKEELIENALTLVRNKQRTVPIQQLTNRKIAALSIGERNGNTFHKRLRDYASVQLNNVGRQPTETEINKLTADLSDQDLVIVSIHGMNNSASKNFGISSSALRLLEQINQQSKVVVVVFGNPYSLKFFDDYGVVLEAYNDDSVTQDKAAQALFGAIGLNGRLPISASNLSRFNAGVSTQRNFRLGYSIPERVGMNSDTLKEGISRIASQAITSGATPGCVVLVARHGKVVYHEAFGHHTYRKQRPVQRDDVYDLASITKVSAATLAMMDLVQLGIVDLEENLGTYVPNLSDTNKDDLKVGDILSHRAALRPWIPFYTGTLDEKGRRIEKVYQAKSGGAYNVEVANDLYMVDSYMDSIWYKIDASELRSNNNYRYSDLGFYYMSRLVEEMTGQELDDYVKRRFYDPLGLCNIGFNPRGHFDLSRIPPTEKDGYWRKQVVHGHVHDMGAAMLGGVSGHAGLFANAHDLAVVSQLFLQRGIYANQVLIDPNIVRKFTSRVPGATRRGLGFDMKQLDPEKSQNVSELAGDKTFGHLGFTGTCFWADPEEELLYIFLSNRTFPSMRNNKLGRDNIRPKIQSVAYRSILHPLANHKPINAIDQVELPEEVKSIN